MIADFGAEKALLLAVIYLRHKVVRKSVNKSQKSFDLCEGNKIFEEFKGALTEQYVLQQLKSSGKVSLYYWSAEKSTGEIDFIFQSGGDIIPLEVKASENLQAKSLKNYCLKYQPKQAIRSSMSDYRQESWLTNVPLYAINVLMELLEQDDAE